MHEIELVMSVNTCKYGFSTLRDPKFVLVATPEYPRRLFHFLQKEIRVYLEKLPRVDSDEERHNKKGQQLLDRIGDVNRLRRAQDLGVIVEPCKRIDAYNESVWHRAVHAAWR